MTVSFLTTLEDVFLLTGYHIPAPYQILSPPPPRPPASPSGNPLAPHPFSLLGSLSASSCPACVALSQRPNAQRGLVLVEAPLLPF